MDEFLRAALEEAEAGFAEGGIPIGSVLVHRGRILGRGHNRRVQKGSAILHGEMDALENAGRQPARVYRECVIYTTLSPCSMCSGTILLYCAVCRVQGRVGCNHPNSQVVEVVSLQDFLNLAAIDQFKAPQNNYVGRSYSHPNLSR